MFVLGIQGSPRKNGNSEFLLSAFLEACKAQGARTETIRPHERNISPCKELIVCEKRGFCPIRDDMEAAGYRKVKQADALVLATPVFFYGVSAQAKIFIDRCQMFWGRKYKLRLKDPDRHHRRGFLLSVAASAGKRLFDGVELTTRYFFDAVSADYSGALTYKRIEAAGDIRKQTDLDQDINNAVARMLDPIRNRTRQIFLSPGNGSRALMAAAFAKEAVKGRCEVIAAGMSPPDEPAADIVKAMAETELDVKYLKVHAMEDIAGAKTGTGDRNRAVLISSNSGLEAPGPFGKGVERWNIGGPGDTRTQADIRDEIANRVAAMRLTPSP